MHKLVLDILYESTYFTFNSILVTKLKLDVGVNLIHYDMSRRFPHLDISSIYRNEQKD